MRQALNFIHGESLPAHTGGWLERLNPTTGEPLTQVADSDLLDLARAIQAANNAFHDWSKITLEERVAHLEKFTREIEKSKETLAKEESLETGRPIVATRESIERAIQTLRFSIHAAQSPLASGISQPDSVYWQSRHSLGAVALITPSCDVVLSLCERLMPALLMGNTVVAKPSSKAALTASLIAQAALTAGLPPGVFNLVQGRGVQIGSAIVEHPGLMSIAFAGRTETGRTIAKNAAEFLKRLQLSLSACNSALIFSEADLEKTAVQVARLSLSHLVSPRLRAQRIFVQEVIYKKFLEVFTSEVSKLKIGDPLDETTEIGPLDSANRIRDFSTEINLAVSERGKPIEVSSEIPSALKGFFAKPSAMYDLTLCSTLQQTEASGPLALIASFKYQYDAVKQANNTPFAFATHVFQPNAGKAARTVEKIDSSRVFLNPKLPVWSPAINYDGAKQSGLGREGIGEWLRFFSRTSWIAHDIRD